MADEEKDKDKDETGDKDEEELPPSLVKMVKRIMQDTAAAEKEEKEKANPKWYQQFLKDAP